MILRVVVVVSIHSVLNHAFTGMHLQVPYALIGVLTGVCAQGGAGCMLHDTAETPMKVHGTKHSAQIEND